MDSFIHALQSHHLAFAMTGNIWALWTVDISRRKSLRCLAECSSDGKCNSHIVSTGKVEAYWQERQLAVVWSLELRWSHAMIIATSPVDIIPHAELCSVMEKMFLQSHRSLTPCLSSQCYLQLDQRKQMSSLSLWLTIPLPPCMHYVTQSPKH